MTPFSDRGDISLLQRKSSWIFEVNDRALKWVRRKTSVLLPQMLRSLVLHSEKKNTVNILLIMKPLYHKLCLEIPSIFPSKKTESQQENILIVYIINEMHTGRHSTVQRCFISTNIKHLTFFLELKLDYTLLQKKEDICIKQCVHKLSLWFSVQQQP